MAGKKEFILILFAALMAIPLVLADPVAPGPEFLIIPAIFLLIVAGIIFSLIYFVCYIINKVTGKKKVKPKEDEKDGRIGMVLGLIGLLTFGGFLILPILGLIFSIKQLRRKSTNLAVSGVVFSIVSLILAGLVIFWWIVLLLEPPYSGYECADIQIRIIGANAQEDSVKVQRFGGANTAVVDFKIVVNGNAKEIKSVSSGNNSLMPLEQKTYIVDYDLQPGDEIQVAPIILYGKKEVTCQVIGETKAV